MVKKNLIFIPGLGYSSNIWRKLVRYIPKEKYNIHLLDIPNYASLYKGWPLNFPHFGTWLSDILLEKRVKPPYILVGHSLGGYISLEYAIKNKNKVDRLILTSSPLRNPDSPSPFSYKFVAW